MFWRGAPTLPLAGEAPSQARLIAAADLLRDKRQWRDAAAAYRLVLSEDSAQAAIWVQLGHALKESGDLPGGEGAYRQALAVDPGNADVHVQLGHALKLQGRRDEAIAAYAAALQIDSGFPPALAELIALGAGAVAGAARGNGQVDLHDLLRMTQDMRTMLEKVERMLPDIASLSSIAIGQYGLFRDLYRLPPAPATERTRRWAVLIVASDGEIAAPLASVARQTMAPGRVMLARACPSARSLATQCGNYGFAGPVEGWDLAGAAADWLLIVADGATLHERAIEWFDWAADNCPSLAIYPDEEWDGGDTGEPVPNLKAAYDRFADPALYDHAVMAVRAGVIEPGSDVSLADLIRDAAEQGGVGHLARVMGTRPGPPPRPCEPTPTQIDPDAGGRISVIIPTRDGIATLRPCLDALRSYAARPDALDVVILDNQSTGAETLIYLAELAGTGRATVLPVAAAFNWSALNNTGAEASRGDILLFINDDVELQTMGWDHILRTDLAISGVGAVGALLTYPNGALQHAGLVFGPGGRCEHEGVGVARIPAQIAARWRMRHQVGAVTGAFLACRADEFNQAGRFDPTLPIWFNDVDFCLRLRKQGRAILFEPAISGLHHESRTLATGAQDPLRRRIWDGSLAEMHRRWGDAMAVDPGFNPHFSRVGRPFESLLDPSVTAVRNHLLASATPHPWRPGRLDTSC